MMLIFKLDGCQHHYLFHTKQFIRHEGPRLKISKMRPINGHNKKVVPLTLIFYTRMGAANLGFSFSPMHYNRSLLSLLSLNVIVDDVSLRRSLPWCALWFLCWTKDLSKLISESLPSLQFLSKFLFTHGTSLTYCSCVCKL
jgi:hypothetical protein